MSTPTTIFWAEGDDQARALIPDGQAWSNLVAYLLMGHRVILHPAYVWQSDPTKSVVLGAPKEVIGPAAFSVFVGSMPSVSEYIQDRIDYLRRAGTDAGATQTELNQYLRHGEDLIRDAAELDHRFTASRVVTHAGWSRDARFRQLVRAEMTDLGRLADNLFSILLTQGGLPERVVRSAASRLIDYTHNPSNTVSGDSLIDLLVREFSFERERLRPFYVRLHLLHWEAHSGASIHVPFAKSRRQFGALDPYDPDVFWTVLKALSKGKLVERFLELPSHDVLRACLDLRQDTTWKEFLKVYAFIVEEIDREYANNGLWVPQDKTQAQEVLRQIKRTIPGLGGIALQRVERLKGLGKIVSMLRSTVLASTPNPVRATLSTAKVAGILVQVVNETATSTRADLRRALRSAIRLHSPRK